MSAPVAGVDGCRGRWLVVRRWPVSPSTSEPEPGPEPRMEWRPPEAELIDDIAPLIDDVRLGRLSALAIDMPIGLLDHHPRSGEVEARKHLGPRRSSVFPTPIRAILGIEDYDEAKAVSRAAVGIAPSRQAFNLLPAIAHLDALVTADDQDRVVEAHPELAFARLAGAPLPETKRSAGGRAMRRRLLVDLDRSMAELIDSSRLPMIDLLDAAALTVTAERVVAGDERRLGHERDHRRRRAEIVW